MDVLGESRQQGGSLTGLFGHGKAFRPYSAVGIAVGRSGKSPTTSRVVTSLTKALVETYQKCNPSFRYLEAWNPKQFLTSPSVGVLNDGYDNENSDLILYVNLALINSEGKRRYIVKEVLGQGTFGQVAKCLNLENDSYVAVKVIKNQPAYYQQAVVEVSILHMLNQKLDPNEEHHIVRILDYFVFQHHLCISFEMLGSNLYEIIKLNQFKGLSLSIVQMFSKQILHALVFMKDAGIIHCDLKPENILITSVKPAEIKVIDFGSACMEGHTVYSYIQSRYYRSPEVLLGYPYTTSIDMWSFGCIVAELFLGLPLFPGASDYDLLKRMMEILGGHPPDYLLRNAKNTSKFFKHVRSVYHLEHDASARDAVSAYQVLTEAEYEARESKPPLIGKRYFNFVKLEDIITNYPHRKNLREDEVMKENLTRLALVDFLRGLVEFDPVKRWSPLQASGHPFITGEPFTSPYRPSPETPRIPVMHPVTVDHNPGGGHWLAAGLSPQVSNATKCLPHNNSYIQKSPMSYSSSYGSMGNHGSYNDNTAHYGSYGSYGDNNSLHAYYSSVGPHGYNMHGQIGGSFLGSSPDARQRPQRSHGSGFGLSPGGMGPMSLGASPSQFTPPSSQMHILSASPGKYGPTSPRSNLHGGSLSKAAAVAQYNRRRNWGQSHESMGQHGTGHCGDAVCSSYSDSQFRALAGSHPAALTGSHCNLRGQVGGGNASSSSYSAANHQKSMGYHQLSFNTNTLQNSEFSCNKLECSPSVPDPADWDPNYSDESLLQEDNTDSNSLSFEFGALHLNDTRGNAILTKGAVGSGHHPVHSGSNLIANQRQDGRLQAYSVDESNPSTSQDMFPGHGRLPYFSQKNPSRLGQQSTHRHNSVASSSSMHGERNRQQYGQPAYSNYNMADSHSSANPIFNNSMRWGQKFGPGIATTLPSHHSPDYGGIS